MTICICDDDADYIKNVRSMINNAAPHDNVIYFSSGFAMLDYLEKPRSKIDVLFLDLEMPGLSGEETAAELRQRYPDLSLIIVTDHPERALPCYEFYPIHYIVKPITAEHISVCLRRAKRFITFSESLRLKTANGYVNKCLYEIISIESRGIKTEFIIDNERISIYQSLTHYENILSDKGFYRISRDTIINLAYVDHTEKDTAIMQNGTSFNISKRRKSGFMSALLKWRKAYA